MLIKRGTVVSFPSRLLLKVSKWPRSLMISVHFSLFDLSPLLMKGLLVHLHGGDLRVDAKEEEETLGSSGGSMVTSGSVGRKGSTFSRCVGEVEKIIIVFRFGIWCQCLRMIDPQLPQVLLLSLQRS